MIRPSKVRKQYTCDKCGYVQSKWFGKCPKCHEFCTPIESDASPKKYKRLQSKTPLKTKTPLKAKTPFKPKSVKVMSKESYSIFTDDLYHCIITGDPGRGLYGVHIHHIFGGANKENSEKFGFLIPLRCDWHDMAEYGIHFDRNLDLYYKRLCEDYWLECIGSKEDFIQTFGQWW
jgi:hypothetical protein